MNLEAHHEVVALLFPLLLAVLAPEFESIAGSSLIYWTKGLEELLLRLVSSCFLSSYVRFCRPVFCLFRLPHPFCSSVSPCIADSSDSQQLLRSSRHSEPEHYQAKGHQPLGLVFANASSCQTGLIGVRSRRSNGLRFANTRRRGTPYEKHARRTLASFHFHEPGA